MGKRTALIVVGRFKDEWQRLTASQQNDFVERVGKTITTLGLASQAGYRLVSAPGAFISVWEATDRNTIDRAIKNLEAIGYTRYIDARWMIGEREEIQEP